MSVAVLFDLDGTLTDSSEGIIGCALKAFEAYGIEFPDKSVLRSIIGPPLKDSFLRFGVPEDKTDAAVALYRKHYVPEGMLQNYPYPGIEEVLQKLKEQGYHLYVATSKPEFMAKEILDHFGLAKYFDIIGGALTDRERNQKSDVIAYLLGKIPEKTKVIMVGDTKYDVLGAAAHRIPTVCVGWGFGEDEEMLDAGAVAIVQSMDELYHQLTNM
jgi:phosphoglycolate phosphatase